MCITKNISSPLNVVVPTESAPEHQDSSGHQGLPEHQRSPTSNPMTAGVTDLYMLSTCLLVGMPFSALHGVWHRWNVSTLRQVLQCGELIKKIFCEVSCLISLTR